MATIAFAHNEKVWTTEYSFEADNYNFVDNQFISFLMKDVDDVKRICWEHEKTFISNDVGYKYNSFHGEDPIPSFFTVSMNERPSVEKTLRSMSIETNQPNFSAAIRTNAELEDDQGIKLQSTVINDFELKEEALYANIMQSSTNSKANMHLIGVALEDVENFGGVQRVKIKKLGESYLAPYAPASTQTQLLTSIVNNLYGSANITASAIGVPNDGQFKFFPSSTTTNQQPGITTVLTLGESYYFFIGSDDYLYINTQMFSNELSSMVQPGTPIFMYTLPQLDGDEMRGKYALVSVIQNYAPAPFEIYGLNLEYSQSKLDTE